MHAIWVLAFPIILSNITIPLLGAVDAAVMGHMDSAAYLGAVAVGGLIFDYIYWGFGFLRLSTTGLTAQAIGANNGEEARAIFGRAALIALGGALLLWASQPLIFYGAALVIDASYEVEQLARTYFTIRIWSAPAALLNYALIGWILAHRNTKGVLIQQVITNLTNVILDLWFVMGLGYGVEGVAWATVIAQYTGLMVGLTLLQRNLSQLEGHWRLPSIFNLAKIKRLMSMNFDLFIRTVCLLSAFAWFTAQGAKLGDLVLAANAILLQFQQFTSYALDGFAHAVEVLSGHSAGRKNKAQFKRDVKSSTQLAFLFACGFSLIYFTFAGSLINLFSDIEPVLALAKDYTLWMALLPLVSIWGFQLDGIYFGLTETRTLRNMMILSLALYLPLSIILRDHFENHGLWAAFTIFFLFRGITLGMRFPSVEKRAFP
ncbi:MATE family efflux transporter [Terasakiella sp. SH-1]|uniref:MATE family efflux transporter n=1 Tax=Terasakiella sp. SH-1 TaxID=2560057 RepID=UPI0010733334|nr:MATE family efflux transporter [Terasakiella sp. SH-1]